MSQVSIIDIEGNHPQIPTEFIANVGSAIPIANQLEILGAKVPAGVLPVYTTGAGNTITTNVQISQAIAASNALNVGLAAFNSANFTVDANGFVSLVGGSTQSVNAINVDSNIFPGTDPVLPTVGGVITVTGGQIAAGSTVNVIRTNSLAANTYTIEVQRSIAVAATDITKNGVSHFRTSDFTVDSNAFVILNTTGAGKTITGDTGGALSPTANNWNILGGPGVTTSGTGSTLTINSVVFTDTTAVTLAVDNGYFATAAGTYPLPATAVQGEMLIVVCDTSGAVVLDAPANNFIRIGSLITASGGTVTSTLQGDSLTLRYRLSSLTWEATSVIGTWLVA